MDRKQIYVKEAGIVMPFPAMAGICPYCRKALSKGEALKRKIKKGHPFVCGCLHGRAWTGD